MSDAPPQVSADAASPRDALTPADRPAVDTPGTQAGDARASVDVATPPPDTPTVTPDAPMPTPTDVRPPDTSPPVMGRFASLTAIPALMHAEEDDDPAISGDGLELFYTSYRPGTLGLNDIWVSRRNTVNDPWGAPVHVPELSSSDRDKAPTLSADGLRIWLASDRPGGPGSDDLWTATRTCRQANCMWTTPVLVAQINSGSEEGTPAVFQGDLRMVFRRSGDLFLSARAVEASPWGAPMPLAELNSGSAEGGPHVAPDGARIYFDSARNGDADIFIATWDGAMGRFRTPVPVPELNTSSNDVDPSLTADERIIVFSSRRSGNQEIFEARR